MSSENNQKKPNQVSKSTIENQPESATAPARDYKSTVLLPITDFPMKGNLPQKEPEIIEAWNQHQIYQKLQKKNENKPTFTLPDGPPYANGSIHIGHALNKILKDIIIKYKNMQGFCSPFIPGWDCHGLPIEHAVMKSLGPKLKDASDDDLRKLCRAEAKKWIDHQAPQFKRLGVLADWEHPYYTMDSSYEAEQIREFARAYNKGLIYLGTKPVYWNWTLQTALADAEVEYHPHKSPAIYVKFDVADESTLKRIGTNQKTEKVSFVIWTTTPWTLPANLGICLNPDFEYGVYHVEELKQSLIIASALKEFFEKDTGLKLSVASKTFKGNQLDQSSAQHPFIDRKSLVVMGAHVTADAGTGCVHTAPGHGADDYKVGIKYGLAVLSPVDEKGCYTEEYAELKGTHIFKANPLIIEKLKSSGHLLGYKEIEHSYPHCWRSKTPLIFRATPQWFLSLDQPQMNIREKALNAIKEIQFFPAWGKARFQAMMEGRPDWCLSRQRVWGVPLPVFFCIKTGKPLVDINLINQIADIVEKGGIESFYSPEVDRLLEKVKPEGEFGSQGFKRSKDIFDVWFDSGICHAAVQRKRKGMSFPADLYLEGSDQHRGWFNTSLISSLASAEKAPFKALITHGFVTDSQGFKMSKSKGNVVDPQVVSGKSGAEILRFWTVYEDYGGDIKCGSAEFDRVTEAYRRIRNTLRFMLGTLHDFNFEKDQVKHSDLTLIDQWALARFYAVAKEIEHAYDHFEFNKVFHSLNLFFTVDLSAVYLDILKDRLYTWQKNGLHRKSAQTVIYMITDSVIKMIAPILSFLAEEAYAYLPKKKLESIFLEDYPKPSKEWQNSELLQRFEVLLKIRSEVQKELETLRAQKQIGASLQAQVEVFAESTTFDSLTAFNQKDGLKSDLREFLIVSNVKVSKGPYKISVGPATGDKCERCWIYSESVHKHSAHPGLCTKCLEALAL
jgi:isoleucyl-tRNA synthetase